jgi:hypothetical protein
MGVDRKGNLYIVLPQGPNGTVLTIIKATRAGNYKDYGIVWQRDGFPTEPLLDIEMLEDHDILSIFSITDGDGHGDGNVVVLDFTLN